MRPAALRPAVREHENEPVSGLPERLPAGEAILWQGAPDWRRLARRAFHVRAIGVYFALLAAWRAAAMLAEGAAALPVLGCVALILLLGAVPVAILAAVACLSGRTTLYTLTDRRLVMRVGIALPMTLNIPYDVVEGASARLEADGGGDVVLRVMPPHRMSWVALWPHARPWHFGRPEPMLRCIPDAAAVAGLLSRALAAQAAQPVPALRGAAPDRAAAADSAVAA